MSHRRCKNSPDIFCYVCGQFTPTKQRRNITTFLKKAYRAYFGIQLGDQDKSWAPHKVCRTCTEQLRQWINGKREALPFGVPMIWREQSNHGTDCYFCSCNLTGYNTRNRHNITYPNIPSAILPTPHGPDVPVPKRPDNFSSSTSESEICSSEVGSDYEPDDASNIPRPLTQAKLNDLVRDLGLSKESAEILGSRLHEENLLSAETSYSWYRKRELEFAPYYSEENKLVFCNNIQQVMLRLGLPNYDPTEWRLFIDASKRSLKSVLLHNGNLYASLPVGYSVIHKESYENLELLLTKTKYEEHKWQVCGDFKVISLLLGQQLGYTKFPCFLCEWDSRAKAQHWIKKEWPRRQWNVGSKNIKKKSLIEASDVLLPPLHIKLGLMKQFVKALDKEGHCFLYISEKFPGLSNAKVKEGIFTGPDIRKLLRDDTFESKMNSKELLAWQSFRDVVTKFLGNTKDPDYKNLVNKMLNAFKELGCNMSLKVHMLHSHLDYFPENLGDYSEEHGERFHQDLKELETRYQGKWSTTMLADYCWMMKRETPRSVYKRQPNRRSFTCKKTRSH